jgi:hypothetical protein
VVHVYEKLQSVAFERLPEPIQKVYLTAPILSAIVETEGSGFKLTTPSLLDRPANQALVPKLGIKSWRDSGSLGVIYEGVNIRTVVERLLQSPTQPQRTIAQAWIETGTPLKLYLLPYVDFSQATEVRFLATRKRCNRISLCLRGQSRQSFNSVFPRIAAFANAVAQYLAPWSQIIDIVYFPTGEIRLVEINPGLTPLDIAWLRKAQSV